ncbi:fibronectin type III domain-containing protein [Flavobacterium enshiense]|uniref:hypothetical protein n=1 Tax=Flavobacterium enshiense TaxID=1341165 RepID=UPI00345DC83A
MNGVRIIVGDDITNKDIIFNGEELDLFKDETIQLTLKQTDFSDIGTNFSDYTQPFSVPASSKNNRILKYWYDVNNDEQFSSVDGIPARIDIDGVMFKRGTIRIINYQSDNDGNPKNYSLNFTAGLKSLADSFAETNLNQLSFTQSMGVSGLHNFEYTDDMIRGIIQNNSNADLEIPMVSVKRLLDNYDNFKYQGNNQNGLRKTELRPAMKFSTIINTIEKEYNLKFGGSFVTDFESPLNKLYMWCNKNEEPYTNGGITMDFNGTTIRTLSSPIGMFGNSPTNYDTGTASVWINTTNNITRIKKSYITFGTGLNSYRLSSNSYMLRMNTFTNNSSIPYRIYLQEVKMMANGVTVNEAATIAQTNEGYVWTSNWVTGNQSTDYYQWVCAAEPNNKERFFRWRIEAKGTILFTSTQLYVRHSYSMNNVFFSGPVDPEGFYTTQHLLMSNATNDIRARFDAGRNLPDLTVSDFMRSLFKMFNLVIVPIYNPTLSALFGTEKIFLLETYKKYYGALNEFDITNYVKRNVKENKLKTYKNFELKHADSSYGTNIDFKSKQIPNREYGSVKAEFPNGDGGDLKVDTKFGLMIWREMPNVGITGTYSLNQTWIIADALNEDYSKGVFNKPTIFFYNGKSSLTQGKNLSFVYDNNQSQSLVKYSIFSNLDKITGLYTTTNTFSTEEMFGQGLKEKSLFYNYYSGLINGVYSPYSREFEVKAVLPKYIYTQITLGSQIIIGQNKYSIIDITIELTSGETTLKLTNVVEQGDILENDGNLKAPQSPATFTAKSNSSENVITWEDTVEERINIKNYTLEYTLGTGSTWQYLDTITSSLSFGSYTHTGVTQGATYSYRIKVSNSADIESENYSYTFVETFDNEPPTLPSSTIPQVYANYIKMDWSGVTDATEIGGYYASITRTGYSDPNIPIYSVTSSTHFSVTYDKAYDIDNFPAPPGFTLILPNTDYDITLNIYDVYGNTTSSVYQVTTTDSFSYSISDNSQGASASNICLVNPPSLPIYTGKPIELIEVGDTFYTNTGLTASYNGGGEWWKVGSLSDYKFKSYRIASYGEILEINDGCPDYYFQYNRPFEILDASIYTIQDGLNISSLGTQYPMYLKKKYEHIIVGTDKLYLDTNGTVYPSASIMKINLIGLSYSIIKTDSNGVIVETLLA